MSSLMTCFNGTWSGRDRLLGQGRYNVSEEAKEWGEQMGEIAKEQVGMGNDGAAAAIQWLYAVGFSVAVILCIGTALRGMKKTSRS